jgi:3-hydroxybutyryl-CoA dehydratase
MLEIGQKESVSKTLTEYDVYQFAGITGDFNPVHIDKESAKNSRFKKQVCHGMLVSSFISTVLGMKLPGPGTIYLEQNSKFVKPVYLGDTITAEVEVKDIDGKIITLETRVYNQLNDLVVSGEAKVMCDNGAI